jgi:hypothetical protein
MARPNEYLSIASREKEDPFRDWKALAEKDDSDEQSKNLYCHLLTENSCRILTGAKFCPLLANALSRLATEDSRRCQGIHMRESFPIVRRISARPACYV